MNFRLTAIAAVVAIASSAAFAATAWNSATTYTGGQVVTYQGKDYKAKWWTQGNVPGAEQWGPWELQATSATPTTPPVAGDCNNTSWSETAVYVGGNVASYQGRNYQAKWWTQGNAPSNNDAWQDLGPCDSKATPTPTATPIVTATPVVTAAPTATPVVTAAPTATPVVTAKPTATPVVTAAPTATPVVTAKPTASPVVTAAPTATPVVTAKPTATPVVTAAPTATPVVTAKPTATPVVTAAPTTTPVVTAKPTATPVVTAAPTATPVVTAKPTATPVVTAAPTATPVVTAAPTAAPVVTPAPVVPPNTGKKEVGTYFAEWSIYARKFYLKNMQDSGQASKLTFLNYSFANVYNRNGKYVCDAGINKTEQGNQDGGDAWAVYQKGFASNESVDGVADSWGIDGQKVNLKGNMNQLKKLKAKNPNLKALISLGGWTWSKYFSVASATPALREALVSSCIDVWIKGNLPFDAASNAGGPGTGAGVFDGIDIDWEYPGVQGIGTNTVDAVNDRANYTLLMQEFRKQLDALGASTGKKYLLTVAIGAGDDKIAATDPAEYSKHLDWINIMSYDYNGGWDAAGPTDFQSNLYQDPASPRTVDPKTGKVSKYYTDAAVKDLIARGVPAAKLHMGVPFYGRGWTGVTNVNNGLYQKATGAAKGSYESGIEDYKVLKNAPGTEYVHPATQQTYKFDGSTFWSYDTPRDIKLKADYANAMGMGGIFSWEADGDTANGELVEAMTHINK